MEALGRAQVGAQFLEGGWETIARLLDIRRGLVDRIEQSPGLPDRLRRRIAATAPACCPTGWVSAVRAESMLFSAKVIRSCAIRTLS